MLRQIGSGIWHPTTRIQMLIMLYRYNKRRRINARDVPLSGRYQYAENVATLAVLVPSVLIWGVVCLVAEMFEPFFYIAWKTGDRDAQVFISQVKKNTRFLYSS